MVSAKPVKPYAIVLVLRVILEAITVIVECGVVVVGTVVVVLVLLRRLYGGVGAVVFWLGLMIVGGFEIQFGREEFCLVTRLRFGVDISSEFIVGPFPFRRRVFPSCMDGHELRYTVPEWCFRLVDNKNAWNIYPCSSYVWPTLYEQLRDANVKRWETHFTIERQPDSGRPKYSLMGFTWAFKGAQPSLRLTPDVVEAQAEWWLSSKAFFDGYIREPPRISPLVNQHCRDDVPEYIYRRVVEQDNLLKAQVDKIKSHDDMIQQMIDELQPMRGGRPIKGQVYVGEHCGLIGPRMFTTPRNSFFDGVSVHALTYPGSFDQSMSSCVPKKQADKSRKKTSNANISAFDLGMVVGDDNARDDEVRITGARSTIDFISLENVDPNKVLRLNVECLSFLYNPELVFLDCHIKGFRAMESFWQELVPQMYKAGVDPGPDPAKVGWLPAGARSIVAKSKTASLNPCSNIFLLQTNRHLRGTLDGSTRPYPSWSDVYWVYMPINAEDSKRRTFWSLNEDILKITILKTNTPYPSRKIRRIRACTHQRPQKIKDQYAVSRGLNTPMDDPSMTMEEYIKFEEEKARKRGKVFNWQTATYGKIRVDDDLYDLSTVEAEFPVIVINDAFAPQNTLQCKPQVSTLINDEIDFRISFEESDDEDYTIICDKNSFSYKMISVNNLKTNSENDYEKVMPSIP
ncbi:hypothetical protein Tco_0723543 [Tanacetum coccineum]